MISFVLAAIRPWNPFATARMCSSSPWLERTTTSIRPLFVHSSSAWAKTSQRTQLLGNHRLSVTISSLEIQMKAVVTVAECVQGLGRFLELIPPRTIASTVHHATSYIERSPAQTMELQDTTRRIKMVLGILRGVDVATRLLGEVSTSMRALCMEQSMTQVNSSTKPPSTWYQPWTSCWNRAIKEAKCPLPESI
ncbi:hypothetical protein FOMG_19925 [Fusarium oxysporum f. sp. melonis 26406]|uniref:Uncharacterized protein n=1 Tax=Fusarium oxysporum f. sp. melonis 26406 TaxID=1089452 RepID=W9YUP2_FUSOX|nr:hypothetical protein FOMG_19925 [Fusarium oxysporum f. sp. melonis 26406]